MQLYLLAQVRDLAERKWGSSEPYIVTLVEFGPKQIQWLLADTERLKGLPPDRFEHLVRDRLERMGLLTHLVGHTNSKDGGVDIIAYPKTSPAFLLAVQVKHHRSSRKTGASDVRDFHGVLSSTSSKFNLGMIVTNTTFTPDAQWFAQNNQAFLRLRDIRHLRLWLQEVFVNELEWREIPDEIEIAPGVRIKIMKSKLWTPNS